MGDINQIEETNKINREIRADNLVRETKALTTARLAKILVDLFGSDKPFEKIGARAGQEIEIYFEAWDEFITFILTSDRKNFDCYTQKAKDPISKVVFKVREENVLQVFSDIVRSKSNIFGLLKLLKYLIPGKIKIKGSFIAAIKFARCIMIGKHTIYKTNK
ncbi:MAG: hypothetical protein ACFFDN_46635 [Candidatus Hodarchaeota archaeon]